MTIPFGSSQFVPDDTGGTGVDSGTTGTAGGGPQPQPQAQPQPQPQAQPQPQQPRGCQGDAECPTGYYCNFNGVPVFGEDLTNPYYSCAPIIEPSPTPQVSIEPSVTPQVSIEPSVTPQVSIEPSVTPAPSSTTCSNDFIRCEGANAVYYSGAKDSNGNCTVILSANDPACIECTQDFIGCEGTGGLYYTGEKDRYGKCRTRVVNFDPQCIPICPPDGRFKGCGGIGGTTGIYYTGTYGNGECETYEVNYDARCIESSCEEVLLECNGTTGIYRGRNAQGVCTQIAKQNDPSCPPPPSITPEPSSTPGVTPDPSRTPVPSSTPDPSRTPVPSSTPAPSFIIEPPELSFTPAPSSIIDVPPEPSSTPAPSLTPEASRELPPISLIPIPSPSATPAPTPSIFPSATPIRWRDCVSGILNNGTAPNGYREVAYQGAGGGMCWEPIAMVGFSPDLKEALLFVHERGGALPTSHKISATNPSYGKSYRVSMNTNPNIKITPNNFIVGPRQTIDFIVAITYELVNVLGDGSNSLRMDVNITEI